MILSVKRCFLGSNVNTTVQVIYEDAMDYIPTFIYPDCRFPFSSSSSSLFYLKLWCDYICMSWYNRMFNELMLPKIFNMSFLQPTHAHCSVTGLFYIAKTLTVFLICLYRWQCESGVYPHYCFHCVSHEVRSKINV